ncbi:MAG: nuclear transport factor 2 family protein, partial [Stellaceae bacterium]
AGRRGRFRQLAAALSTAAAALAAPATPSAAQPIQTAEDAIRAVLEEWQSAFNNRDEQRVCDLFAPDLVANYQGEPERDYSSLCELLRSSLEDGQATYRYSMRINEILVYGETAVVRLAWTLEVEKADAAKETIQEHAVDIFRRQAGGSWKISRYLAYPASDKGSQQ